ncbi:MAG: hypothetical protein IJ566_02520 [Cardiobacteriaceae bacterium]|nr:hypothetical protein [Cardiobacteriaceae bacterium]
MTVKLPTTTAVILSEAKDMSIDFSPTAQNDGGGEIFRCAQNDGKPPNNTVVILSEAKDLSIDFSLRSK